ncbi:hypothetical protein [Arthrobacter alpinus]|nr:hypothetical protein [Arthrobacter alpinus]
MNSVPTFAQGLRLPQDVSGTDRRGVPDLKTFTDDVEGYIRLHQEALRNNDFAQRAYACWGLVAGGPASVDWIKGALIGPDDDVLADAAGVLRWIGPPPEWLPELRTLAEALPDGEPADALFELLTEIEGPGPSDPKSSDSESLYGGAYLPFTEPIWFINASFDRVATATREWLDVLGNRTYTHLDEPLPTMFGRFETGASGWLRHLLVATAADQWTAVFSQDGDVGTATVVGHRLNCLHFRSSHDRHITSNKEIVSYGDTSLWIKSGKDALRSIQASYQSRWQWDVGGDPLPFENLESYTAKKIRERFPLSRLNDYCRALGVDRNNADFYTSEGLLIEEDTSAWDTCP